MGTQLFLKVYYYFLSLLIPAVLDSASTKYAFTTCWRPVLSKGHWLFWVTDYFFLRIAELSWNAYRGKLAQGPKLQSWCYWGQTNGSLQEMLSSCAHKESKLLMDALQFGLLLSSFLSNHREQSFRKGFVYSRTLKRQHTRKHYLTWCCISTFLPDRPDFLMGDPEAAARQAAAYGFIFTDALLLTCYLRTFKVKKTFFLHYLWMASITTVRRKIITAINN